MTKKTIEVDKNFLIKLAKRQDQQEGRIAHLEDHLENDLAPDAPVAPGFLFFTASFQTVVAPEKQKAYMDQFRAEIVSVLKQYGVIKFDGSYRQ